MSEQAGFKVNGTLYPFAQRIRLCDPVLVKEVTGLDFAEFAERMDESGLTDVVVRAGLAAVAIWQAYPRWTRDKVRKFIEDIDLDSLEIEAGEDDADPPAEGAEDAPNPSPEP